MILFSSKFPWSKSIAHNNFIAIIIYRSSSFFEIVSNKTDWRNNGPLGYSFVNVENQQFTRDEITKGILQDSAF